MSTTADNEIDVYMDKVELFGQPIERPDYISRKQWMDWWDTVKYGWCPDEDCPLKPKNRT